MFVPLETPISYYQVLQETLKYRCLAIGYRLMKDLHDETKFYGIVFKSRQTRTNYIFTNDKIIVLVET